MKSNLSWSLQYIIDYATDLFEITNEANDQLAGGSWEGGSTTRIFVDASKVVPTSSENRPYNIALVPLIAY